MIKIGCCGFQRSKEIYYKNFKIVELQETFYKIPSEERIKKLRKESPKDFEFIVKCFQGVTHTTKSPTWKKSNIKLSKDSKYGNLQPSDEVFNSWNETLKICKILNSKICIIQLPSTFKDSKENIENAKNFFSNIKRNNLKIAIELRGWNENNIKKICEEFDLIHCIDIFSSIPVYFSSRKIGYFRLHGSPPGKKMYSYKYTDKDLLNLKEKIEKLNLNEIYVLFNNIYMFDDALRFKNLLNIK